MLMKIDQGRRYILNLYDIPDPSDLTLPMENKIKCDNCGFKLYEEEFDLDKDGEVCDSCYQEMNIVEDSEV